MKQHSLYIGLNDKDTKRQLIGTLDAYRIINNICLSQVSGATISETDGIYKHENGEVVIEKSLKIEIIGATEEQISTIVSQAKMVLNQESIMVVETEAKISFK